MGFDREVTDKMLIDPDGTVDIYVLSSLTTLGSWKAWLSNEANGWDALGNGVLDPRGHIQRATDQLVGRTLAVQMVVTSGSAGEDLVAAGVSCEHSNGKVHEVFCDPVRVSDAAATAEFLFYLELKLPPPTGV